jgi:hypothetical protein
MGDKDCRAGERELQGGAAEPAGKGPPAGPAAEGASLACRGGKAPAISSTCFPGDGTVLPFAAGWAEGGETLSWSNPNNWLAVPSATKEEPPQAGEMAAGAGGAGAGGQESKKAA